MAQSPILTDDINVVTFMSGERTCTFPKAKLKPIKAIRLKCLDCSGGQVSEVPDCVIPDCPLYPFRMGSGFKKNLSPEQREKLSIRSKKMVEQRRQNQILASESNKVNHSITKRTKRV